MKKGENEKGTSIPFGDKGEKKIEEKKRGQTVEIRERCEEVEGVEGEGVGDIGRGLSA